jgi:hypothetical protein
MSMWRREGMEGGMGRDEREDWMVVDMIEQSKRW